MTVQWKIENYYKADAMKVYQEIGTENVTPEDIVEKAKDENTELHKCFEWDDTVAAGKYRIEQARKIIRMLVTVPDKKDEPPKRVLEISSSTSVYQPVKFFVQNEDEYNTLLKRALAELRGFQQRYANIKEFEELFEVINRIA